MKDKELEKRLVDLVDSFRLERDNGTEDSNIDRTYDDCILQIIQKFPEFDIKGILGLNDFLSEIKIKELKR